MGSSVRLFLKFADTQPSLWFFFVQSSAAARRIRTSGGHLSVVSSETCLDCEAATGKQQLVHHFNVCVCECVR